MEELSTDAPYARMTTHSSTVKPLFCEESSGLLPPEDWGKWIPRVEGTRRLRLPVQPTMRHITCYSCQKETEVPMKALSALCTHCRTHLMLTDIVLKQGSQRTRLSTYGKVSIARGAQLSGLSIECGSMLVNGLIDGNIHCHGEMRLACSTTIKGTIHTHTLIVEKGVSLHIQGRVEATSIIIYGSVHGLLKASAQISIEATGSLHGNCHTPSLNLASQTSIHQGRWQKD